jgi:hypothetical protein
VNAPQQSDLKVALFRRSMTRWDRRPDPFSREPSNKSLLVCGILSDTLRPRPVPADYPRSSWGGSVGLRDGAIERAVRHG